MASTRLDGHTAIVTGANTGLGRETAKQLALRGCRVIMACRSKHLAMAAREELLNGLGIKSDDLLVCMSLDLGSFQSIRNFVDDFCSNESRLNLLVNNAGVFVGKEGRTLTAEGFETHFGVNHLGHFLLTVLLLDKLKASAPSRIVNVTSEAYKYGKLDFDDLQFERNWKSFPAYARSKTANLLFTVALANRLSDTGVTVYAVHPGLIKTSIWRNVNKCWVCLMRACCMFHEKKVSDGVKPILYCCMEPSLENVSGKYYLSDCSEVNPKPHATDPEIAEQLWKVSEELSGLRNKKVRRK